MKACQNNTPRLSRFTFLLEEGGELFLAYNSLTNGFMKLNKDLYEVLESGEFEVLKEDAPEIYDQLRQQRIITTEREDDDEVTKMEMLSNTSAYSTGMIGITLAPTVSCNLRCPYCFEAEKPAGVISERTCDDVLDFINSHVLCKSFTLNWFGGEPLLGIDRIGYFLDRLQERVEKKESVPMVDHSMITNATLLKGKALEVFKRHPLNSVQITFDGDRERHDKMKFHADGKGTFDEILDNIEGFTEACPDTRIALRVNVDNDNYRDYLMLFEMFRKRFDGRNIQFYPGILRKCGDCDDSAFMTSADIARFNKWLRDNGIEYSVYPRSMNKTCAATAIGAYAIGPRGEIYNCWEDMGQPEALVGSIYKKSFDNPEMIANYMRYGTLFNDPECRKCPVLPICSGGCPKQRVANKLEGAQNAICSEYRDNDHAALNQTLLDFYHSGRWKNKPCCKCSC